MSFPSFRDFAAALYGGREPFPWQERLAESVSEDGWPSEIGIPTGLGKTSCIDIAVWAMAKDALRPPAERRHPTRIWYVVNRRLLVDAAHEHAIRLASALGENGESAGVLGEVRRALVQRSRFSGETASDSGLHVSRLRGGTELGARPPHPGQTSVVLATVPMFASTWLFRGYASSRHMAPVDAAHAGIDSVVLLDEAHLSRPLLELAPKLAQCDIGDPRSVLAGGDRSRPSMVSLSATGASTDPFELDEADHEHATVRQRLDAPKSLELMSVDKSEEMLAQSLAEAVETLIGEAPALQSVCVFVNQPRRAREVADALNKRATQKRLGEPDVLVLTGRMRRREAERAREILLDPVRGVPAGRQPVERKRPLVVVATQTLEVGADLDFDAMVIESCGGRALIQRLGRLNRLGSRPAGRALLVHPSKDKTRAVYGEEPAAVFERLELQIGLDPTLDVSPRRVSEVVGEPADAPPRTGEVLPAHLWEYAKTTTPPPGEAPVELFFDGFDEHRASVSVCWRAHVPEPGQRLIPSVTVDESIEVPLWEVTGELESLDRSTLSVLAADRVSVRRCGIGELRAGDVIVLSVSDGLYDELGWGAKARVHVEDTSIDRWPGLMLDQAFIAHWLDHVPDELAKVVDALDDETNDGDPGPLIDALLGALRTSTPKHSEAEWQHLVSRLTSHLDQLQGRWILTARLPPRFRERDVVAADTLDDLCAIAESAALADHLRSVEELARSIGQEVGLPDDLVLACAEAGRFHDLGKADPRFQRWLSPEGPPEDPLAKSSVPRWRWERTRAASGWTTGGRHEELSGRMIREWLESNVDPPWDVDLVLHLVVSHHGYGRPLLNPLPSDETATTVSWTLDGTDVSVSGDLSDTDWGQPARFRRCCERYGYWGLALLEAVVRQADHIASGVVVA